MREKSYAFSNQTNIPYRKGRRSSSLGGLNAPYSFQQPLVVLQARPTQVGDVILHLVLVGFCVAVPGCNQQNSSCSNLNFKSFLVMIQRCCFLEKT